MPSGTFITSCGSTSGVYHKIANQKARYCKGMLSQQIISDKGLKLIILPQYSSELWYLSTLTNLKKEETIIVPIKKLIETWLRLHLKFECSKHIELPQKAQADHKYFFVFHSFHVMKTPHNHIYHLVKFQPQILRLKIWTHKQSSGGWKWSGLCQVPIGFHIFYALAKVICSIDNLDLTLSSNLGADQISWLYEIAYGRPVLASLSK